ncbi:PREDICTED: fasciclin-2 isoform X2 [Wasmannia auropunctata]|uniref:fasciclin-2 isoform X2 n=1 Tax=Wasmannia auropunctata TaxID=64793 RepID=UPI0005EE9D9B|nr:PREDICTED: fasciclin-2 isoform X2 [Wasmannia auropunctata]
MAARREQRSTCVAIAVLLLQLTAYTNAIEPYLDILPRGEKQSKPVGSSIILTCKPKVDNPALVSQMEWLDPENRVIETRKIDRTKSTTPPMYTELHQDGSLSLFFNSLVEHQQGNYTCKGTYALNVPLSKSVTIDTIIGITWKNAPQNQYPILGEDFDVQCQVHARPPPSIDWLDNNGDLISTNDHYIIDTYSLKIKNVQESDDGVYTCRASVPTTGELQERPIRVEVHIRPVIEEILSPVDIVEGENANIACKASGKPPPMFTWVKSLTQQNLSITDRFGVDPVTGMLTITNVNREDVGEYQCSAANAAGIATATIQVNVIIKPKIMEFLNKTVVEGKNVDIKCKAFGRPPPEVTFRKFTHDKPYVMGAQPQDDRIVVRNDADDVSGETVGTLSIHDALTDNDGLYECVTKNTGGVAYKNGHLTVEFPPSFRHMKNETEWSWEQRPVNLTCIAESIPNATIRWTVHGDQDPLIYYPNMFKQFGNGPNSTLRVTPIDQRFYTTYKCIAMNTHGTREHLIDLREATKPGELLSVKMAEVTATTITFDLIPPTHPDLPITSLTVQYKEEYDVWQHAKNKTWSVGTMYAIDGLKPQTPYDFRFAARNQVGLGNWGNFYREITPGRTVPKEPRILTTPGNEYEISRFSQQYELSWVTPLDNGQPIDMYLIKYCQIRRVLGDWETLGSTCQSIEVNGRTTRQYLKELRYDTFYAVELQAHNMLGYSKPGYMKFKTARGVDTSVLQHQGPLLSSGAIIGIVLATIFIIFTIIDATCCCVRKTGIINYVRERSRRKPVDEEDTKLGSLYGWRFPLPYCDQKMANVAGVTAIPDSGSGKNTIRLVKHTAIDEKEPLKEEKKITPIIDSGLRRETSITFDGKRSVSKTGFVGKDSAV